MRTIVGSGQKTSEAWTSEARMRMRVRDDFECGGHNFVLNLEPRSVLTRRSVPWHAPGSVFCVHPSRSVSCV